MGVRSAYVRSGKKLVLLGRPLCRARSSRWRWRDRGRTSRARGQGGASGFYPKCEGQSLEGQSRGVTWLHC